MSHSTPSPGSRPLSLGVIFLTLYIDLIGFSIIFPLGPDLLHHYLSIDGHDGLLGAFLRQLSAFSGWLGTPDAFDEVLFGGVISSLFSILQFLFAPFWGSLSDRHGRHPILLFTVIGTGLSYALWAVSGSFWIFLLSRLLGGAFGGNLSVATAAVADVTTRAERAKAMGLVGAAFGLGLVTGPLIGAFATHVNLLGMHPGLARYGINPFTIPALIALGLSLVNVVWIQWRFHETLTDEMRGRATTPRLRNPIHSVLMMRNAAVKRLNLVNFTYQIAFTAMEASLVFLSAQRFGYTARENGLLMGFLGFCSILTQGWWVRKLLSRNMPVPTLMRLGLLTSTLGFVVTGLAGSPWELYAGVALLAVGGGFVGPATSGLISLWSSEEEQGQVLGIYRSLGALARAITPIAAGLIFWTLGSQFLYVASAFLVVASWLGIRRLRQTETHPH